MTPSTELADSPAAARGPAEAPLGGEGPTTGPLLSVLMPVYNERRTLKAIVRRVLESPTPIPLELVAVDDGSTDGSAELLRELAAQDQRIRPVFQERNRGKGAAIQAAIRHMAGDIAIIQDADLEYDPAEIGKVIQPILDGRADAVFGSRFLSSDYRRVLYYWHSLGNGALTWLCNVLCDINLTDMETCYKAVRADILRQTPLRFRDFAIEPELTFRLAQWGIRLYEVPVSYAGRTYVEGKKIRWTDGLRALWAMFWCKFIDTRFTTHDGYYILVAVRNAGAFNRWMYRQIAPYVGRRVLEAGCGIGNLTELLLDSDRLVVSDVDPFYAEMIGRRFGHMDNVRTVRMDLTKAGDYEQLAGESLDTIICLNVLEHIGDDEDVLRHFYRALGPGDHAIVLVPQHPWLYSPTDKALGHERRYTKEGLAERLRRAGFEVVHQQGFNRLGALGWYVSGKLLGREHLSPGQMKAFNRILPLAKLVERIPGWPALSTIAVGRKPA
ncbi:MAG TPA: bifunctional glycosyltransferase/class I SAM-dependent methyltransferase [Isosphaeraceae bacterium]